MPPKNFASSLSKDLSKEADIAEKLASFVLDKKIKGCGSKEKFLDWIEKHGEKIVLGGATVFAGTEASRYIKGDNNALKRYEIIIKNELYKILDKTYKVKTKCIHNIRKRRRLYKYLKLMMHLYRISPKLGEKLIARSLRFKSHI